MTVDNTPLTPRRRSKRGQPIAAVVPDIHQANASISTSAILHTRRTQTEDLIDADFDALQSGDIELEELETRFHGSFTANANGRQPLKTYGRSTRKSGVDAGGGEVYKVGDTVCMQSSARLPSVAVIVAVWSIVGQGLQPSIRVKIHWFIRPSELPGIRARRNYYENEVYYSLSSTAVVPVSSILDHCTIFTASDASAASTSTLVSSLLPLEPPSGIPSHPDRTFCCRLAINAVRGLYYAFTWEHHVKHALDTSSEWGATDSWDVIPDDALPKTPGKKQRLMTSLPEEENEGDDRGTEADDEYQDVEIPISASEDEREVEQEELPVPDTPSRKRKRRAPSTPRRKRTTKADSTTLAAPTPHSKAALRARAKRKHMAVRPPPPDRAADVNLHLESLPQDAWLRAMHVLHVASRPEALPCREEEYGKVLRSVEELVEEGSGGCVYISGVPGTGKTATVHAVVRELKRMAEQNEGNPFTYVEINGLRIPEPSAAYGLLWEAVSGHDVAREGHLKISSKEALKQLSKHFSSGGAGPSGHACVVLMDELDQLMTNKQDVVYNFFNWPTLVGSRLVVLAVANTMDLPERVMSGRVRSRLGMTRINFQPYTTPQLEKIVHARLAHAKEGLQPGSPDVIGADGIKFAAMKVSSISGDARRVLDICRRTVELVQPRSRTAGTDDVKQVIKDMQNSPTAAYLRDLSFHERLMLAAMLKCIKKEGVEEIRWGDVQRQHIVYMNILTGEDDSVRRPTSRELSMVLESLLASRAMLCEEGVVVARKGEDEKRVVLNLEHMEVERVLGEVGGTRWRNALSV